MLPNSLIQENMQESAKTYSQAEAFVYSSDRRLNKTTDNYADAIWLNIAWYMGKGNPFTAALDTCYYDGEELGENVGLYKAVTKEIEPNTDYTRYWHGTAGIIRFLHLFTDVEGMKKIGFGMSLFLAALLMALLIWKGKSSLAVCVCLSLCMVQIWNIRFSMEYQPAFLISLGMCIGYLCVEKKGDTYLNVLSIIGGVLIAFFDFLTTETMVFLMPMILVTAVRSMEGRLADFTAEFWKVVRNGVLWMGAYVGTFVTKWILVSVILGENKVTAAMESVQERIGGDLYETQKLHGIFQRLKAPAANLAVLFGAKQRTDFLSLCLGVVWLLGVSLWVLYFFSGKKKDKTATKILLFLGSMILLRYVVLCNHSYLHAFFTYRGLVSLLLAIFCILVINSDIEAKW